MCSTIKFDVQYFVPNVVSWNYILIYIITAFLSSSRAVSYKMLMTFLGMVYVMTMSLLMAHPRIHCSIMHLFGHFVCQVMVQSAYAFSLQILCLKQDVSDCTGFQTPPRGSFQTDSSSPATECAVAPNCHLQHTWNCGIHSLNSPESEGEHQTPSELYNSLQ